MTNKANNQRKLSGLPDGIMPYDWALKQLRVDTAHKITQGSKELIVAVIDLGYTDHPDMDGHLWENPVKPGLYGWDYADNDASLENTDESGSHNYRNGHHVFVAGEVANVVPKCPIMIVRVGYNNPDSWWRGIRYAVDHGAKVLIMPHGYLTGAKSTGTAFFYQGMDFTFPSDNTQIRDAVEYAYDNNCLIVQGVAGNRGRRVAAMGLDAILNVGSTNCHDQPANICCSADYTEIGAPGGQRGTGIEQEEIWGYGPDENYIPFTGGCMASGFGGGAAALVWSRFPQLSNDELRQVLCNTARPAEGVTTNADGWEPKLGYGIVNVGKAAALKKEAFCRNVRVIPGEVKIVTEGNRYFIEAIVENHGVFDANRALITIFNGDPRQPVDPGATRKEPAAELQTCQIGHTIARVRGFHKTKVKIELFSGFMGEFKPFKLESEIWFEIFYLDRHDKIDANYTKVNLNDLTKQ